MPEKAAELTDPGVGSPETTAPMTMNTQSDDPWKVNVAMYLWGTSIMGKARTGEDFDVGFSDIMDKLKFAGMGMASIHKGKWEVFGDAIYLKVEDDLQVLPDHILDSSSKVEISSWITEMAAGYTVYEHDVFTVDVFAGARYLYMDIDMHAKAERIDRSLDISGDDGVWNGIAGIKGTINLPKQWFGLYYFDAGTGETQLTFQTMGVVGYRLDKLSIVAGYRYLRYNFDQSDTFGKIMDYLEIKGPIAGLMYSF